MSEATPTPPRRPLRILLIEDAEDDAALTLLALRRGGYEPHAERVQDEAALRGALARGPWDVVLSDHTMPNFASASALRIVREADPDVPFIIVSGSIGEDTAVAIMRAGAQDFVMKDQTTRLVPAIERELQDAEIRRARRTAEEALRVSEARYREMVEELPAVTYIAGLDDERTAFFISSQIDRILGIGPEDHRHLWKTRTHPEDRETVLAALRAVRETRRGFLCEYRLVGPDGREIWFQDHGVIDAGQGRQPAFMRGFMLDITERKRAEKSLREREEQLRRVQKLEAVGRLAGGVAHDFNNLLTPVLGYGRMLLTETQAPDVVREFAAEIVRAAERAAKLTQQLLTFGRRRPEERQRMDLNVVLADLHRFLRRTIGEDIELVTLLSDEPVILEADPTQVEQIVVNLAVNARDAMEHGGCLTIQTERQELAEAAARALGVPPGPYVRLTVRDTGSGMTPEVREHIFEPFFTTKAEGRGTGLGLSIIYGIVQQNAGYIEVDSEPGRGTEFRIGFPRLEMPVTEAAPDDTTPEPGGHETILVVEDEDAVRQLTTRLLTSLGYRVLPAASADEALRIWAQRGEEIDGLITDVVMPHMSGNDLAVRLHQLRPNLPVLLMSGFARGAENNGRPILMKPFTRETLARSLRAALDAAPPR